MNRRNFLGRVYKLFFLYISIPFLFGFTKSLDPEFDQLLAELKKVDDLTSLGKRYTSKKSQTNITKSQRKERILRRLRGSGSQDIKEGLKQLIQQDYTSGRTVRVQKWILSETEADLSALLL